MTNCCVLIWENRDYKLLLSVHFRRILYSIFQEDLASLLRYESSHTKPGETISFEEYIKRKQEGQNDIYYLSAPK